MPYPRAIDGFQFSRSGSQLAGTLAAGDLPRLFELGCRVIAADFEIQGGDSIRGKPCLRVQAGADVELVCQRCLEPLAMHLSAEVELELSASEQEIARAEDDVDRVLAGPAMDVAHLVEDELILVLPDTPKHERCALSPGGDRAGRASPFAELARLRQGH